MDDTGPVEFPAGNYGGLIPTPAAEAAIRKWNPRDQLKPQNACRPPSIVYALQGPFPIEIFQSDVLIVMKLEYYDLVRIIFLDGRKPEADYPHSPTGFSSGHWEGATLVVETTHLEAATITNNGLDHSQNIRVVEHFRLSPDHQVLMATQEYEDPTMFTNRGVRFIAWRKQAGQHVYPYECDPDLRATTKIRSSNALSQQQQLRHPHQRRTTRSRSAQTGGRDPVPPHGSGPAPGSWTSPRHSPPGCTPMPAIAVRPRRDISATSCCCCRALLRSELICPCGLQAVTKALQVV